MAEDSGSGGRRPGNGHRRAGQKEIDKYNARKVTFSKRRSGLSRRRANFRCSAERRWRSSPTPHTATRFAFGGPLRGSGAPPLCWTACRGHRRHCEDRLSGPVREEKEALSRQDAGKEGMRRRGWEWEDLLEELELEELEVFVERMEMLREKVSRRVMEMGKAAAAAPVTALASNGINAVEPLDMSVLETMAMEEEMVLGGHRLESLSSPSGSEYDLGFMRLWSVGF